mgnify:CR=1 FL=1
MKSPNQTLKDKKVGEEWNISGNFPDRYFVWACMKSNSSTSIGKKLLSASIWSNLPEKQRKTINLTGRKPRQNFAFKYCIIQPGTAVGQYAIYVAVTLSSVSVAISQPNMGIMRHDDLYSSQKLLQMVHDLKFQYDFNFVFACLNKNGSIVRPQCTNDPQRRCLP